MQCQPSAASLKFVSLQLQTTQQAHSYDHVITAAVITTSRGTVTKQTSCHAKAHRDGFCQSTPDDVEREVVNSGCEPAEHEGDKQHSAQRLVSCISGQLCCLHEDVIDVMDQKHHAAHLHETAAQVFAALRNQE